MEGYQNTPGFTVRGSDNLANLVLVNENLTTGIDYLDKITYFAMEIPKKSLENPSVPNSTSELLYVDNYMEESTAFNDDSLVSELNPKSPVGIFVPESMFVASLMVLKYLLVPAFLLMIICKLWEIYCYSLRDKTSPLPLPRGRMGLPFIGEMFHFLFLGVSFQRARRKEFGLIYRTHLFGRPTIRVSGEKYIRKLLLGEGQIVETKWPYTTRVILGSDGIVNGSKETHTTIKKLALRALSPRFMETYAPSIQKSVKKHVEEWNRRGEIPILSECKQLITKTMMTVLLGIKEDDPDIQKYITSADDIINSILCIPMDIPNSVWTKGKKAREFIFEQMKTKLKAKMECSNEELFGQAGNSNGGPSSGVDEIAASTSESDSVLVNIIKIARLEGETNMQLRNLQNLSLEIIFAGTQSLQSSSSLLILHLSRNPKVLERLRAEVKDYGLWDCSLDEIPYKTINSLSYTSNVVNEVLRVTPPIPGAIRVAKKTFELDGFQVPKDWQVMFSIRETHELAAGLEKPLQAIHLPYDPSYFACDKCKKGVPKTEEKGVGESKHTCHNKNGPFSFIPFGKGTRMCAGVNYALFVLRVLAIEIARSSNFHLTTPVKLKSIPMTKPAKSVRVYFEDLQTGL